MRTYEERLANIRAKADVTRKAYRAMAASISTLAVLTLWICAVIFLPNFRSSNVPTDGPALNQPTQYDPSEDVPFVTHPSDTAYPDASTMHTLPEPSETIQAEPGPTDWTVPSEPVQPPNAVQIPFHGTCIQLSQADESDTEPVLFQTEEELTAYCRLHELDGAVRQQAVKYESDFFEEKSLILFMKPQGSSSYRLNVSDVLQFDDGNLQIVIDRILPGLDEDGNSMMAYWYIFVEVGVKDIAAEQITVKYVSVYPVGDVSFNATYDSGPGDVAPELDRKVAVIRSMTDLMDEFGAHSDIISKYDTAFFEDNTLIVYYCNESSGMVRHQVTSVCRRNDDAYMVYFYSIYPEVFTEDVGHGIAYIEIDGKIAEDAAVYILPGVHTITNEKWTERYGDPTPIPPDRPTDTNLEFWIGEDVADVDFSGHTEIYGWFGAREFLGQGCISKNDPYVSYLIGAFPDESDGGSFVTCIEICDPNVAVYGLTIQSGSEEFEAVFRTMGYAIHENNGMWKAEKNGITFTYCHGAYIRIRANVTNREGIIY